MNTETRPGVSPLMVALVIVGILAASAFIYFQLLYDSHKPTLPPLPSSTTASPPPATDTTPRELPDLADSDRFVRPLVEQLSEHPELARWLTPDRLVERFVTTVVNVADGGSPRSQLSALDPGQAFTAAERGGELYVAGDSYHRFDTFVEVFTSLDTAAGVRLYRELEPLFDEAYGELGYPSGDFDAALAKAIDHILATPIPSGDVEVERRAGAYTFVDPALEHLSLAQKQFLRMGPSNMRQVHAKLRLMRTALNLD
jgi:Protein of unknown function (DUF3014)